LNSSTRNCRIERLWVEVGSQFARRWRAFFTCLERIHLLDAQNPTHLWLLHTLFLDDIGHDCQLQWGKYEERNLAEELGVSPDAVDTITSKQQANINHEAIHVPSHRNPFRSNEEEEVFFADLREVIAQDITLVDFRLTPEEWGSEVYPTVEAI
ncbi:hypothetical protein SCLCIDRAFT_36106, partial [Scleroderma citrinum Foug A]